MIFLFYAYHICDDRHAAPCPAIVEMGSLELFYPCWHGTTVPPELSLPK
jgi:hypothetical protein